MFLFSTPATQPIASDSSRSAVNAAGNGGPVVRAIKDGADKTGTGFDYLLRTAQRESALDPQAKAATSSATGLFQFIEQTWLGMVKEQGPRHGLSVYADAIKDGDGGRLTVSDAKTRQDILDLRRDPNMASVMAGALTQKNSEALSSSLGRKPTQGELYIAHVMGARGASDLINGAANAPQEPATVLFPDAAAANRNIFYDKAGKARPTSDVYAILTAPHMNAGASAAQADVGASGNAPGASAPAAAWPGVARAQGTMGLFSTEGSRAPVSDSVTKYWATPRHGPRVAALDSGPRFFPRDEAGAGPAQLEKRPAAQPDIVVTGSAPAATQPLLVTAPMPPARPAFFPVSLPASLPASVPVSLPIAGAVAQARPRGPLDLARFLNLRGRS